MSDVLHVSPSLSFPLDAATETFGILAKKGAGKSNAAVVMAEEMFDAKVPWVAIDPKGDWWGIRSSGDGKKPGLSIVVFGGRHGDIPLEPTAGKVLADLILAERLTCVLDVSEFSKADVTRFLVDFADRLYRQAEAEPLHLFMEEAHEYLPQNQRFADPRLLGSMQRIVKMGRTKGLGVTLVSQRSAAINKDVLTQVDTLIVLQTNSPQDRKAVKDWIDVNSDHREALDSLHSLDKGEAWIWSPTFLSKPLQRIRFRRRRTFDSGATPKVGQASRAPATLADVDLAEIKELMAETIEKAKESDPRELQRQIVELRRELAKAKKVETVEKLVEVRIPIDPKPIVDLIGQAHDAIEKAREVVTGSLDELNYLMVDWNGGKRVEKPYRIAVPAQKTGVDPIHAQKALPSPPVSSVLDPLRFPSVIFPKLKLGARRMLSILGGHQDFKVTRASLGTLAGLSSSGGTFSSYFSTLKTNGLISENNGVIQITDRGLAYLGEDSLPIPTTTEELMLQWGKVLKLGARKMLEELVSLWPSSITREELAKRTDLTVNAGTFSSYLSTLKTNGLINVNGSYVRADDSLMFSEKVNT